MTKGTKVVVDHPMLPGHSFPGVVVGNSRNGIRVQYESFGALFTETFWPTRVTEASH